MRGCRLIRAPMLSKAGRRLRAGIVVATAMIGAVGLLHAPFARPLLMRVGGCPVAGGRMTPRESDAARRLALGVETGSATAPARPALGFALDETSLDDARAWARRGQVDCDEARAGLLRCTQVRADALGIPASQGTIDELLLQFDPRGRLVNVTTIRAGLAPDAVASRAAAIVGSLDRELGPSPRGHGDFGGASLRSAGAESISTVAYRYSDYVAEVVAMNAPSGGPTLREHYMSARD